MVTTFNEEIMSGELIKANQKEISIKDIKTVKNKLTNKKQQLETIHQISMDEIRETKLLYPLIKKMNAIELINHFKSSKN